MPVFDAAAAALPAATQACASARASGAARGSPRLRVLATLGALLLGGCTWYHREPLAPRDTSTSTQSLERIQIDASRMPLPELAAHRFDPSDGLDIDEVAMLAVANNPDLKLARDDLGIARAQAYSAGLLPDPQLSVSSDYPGALGTTRAFNYGLSIDVMAIVLRSANQQSADATVAKTDLGLLWQEWQIVAQARQLFIKTRFQQDTLPLLQQAARPRAHALRTHGRSAPRRQSDRRHAERRAHRLQRRAQAIHRRRTRRRADPSRLNALLGLAPEVQLQLRASTDIDTLTSAHRHDARRRARRARPTPSRPDRAAGRLRSAGTEISRGDSEPVPEPEGRIHPGARHVEHLHQRLPDQPEPPHLQP